MNIILKSLAERGVELPDTPQNLQPALRGAGIDRTYCILMTGRCGSTWLASALAKIPGFNQPREYFSEEALPFFGRFDAPQSYGAYVTDLARTHSEDGTFGFKTNANRLFPTTTVLDVARTFSPDYCAWIDMRRANIVKQAFSYLRAMRSGAWHRDAASGKTGGSTRHVSDRPITDADIWMRIASILSEEQQADRFYARHDMTPLRLVYEELLDSRWQVLARAANHIRPGSVTPARLAPLTDATERLSDGKPTPDEDRFICVHHSALGWVAQNRADLKPALIHGWVAQGMTGPVSHGTDRA